MNKNKKILLIFSSFVFLILVVWVILENSNMSFENPSFSERKDYQKDFFSENSFEDREKIISQSLAKKFNAADDKVSVLIAQESDNHVTGLYFISISEEETASGKFFGVISNSVEIVWYGPENPNCEVLLKNSFSEEMAPSCF